MAMPGMSPRNMRIGGYYQIRLPGHPDSSRYNIQVLSFSLGYVEFMFDSYLGGREKGAFRLDEIIYCKALNTESKSLTLPF